MGRNPIEVVEAVYHHHSILIQHVIQVIKTTIIHLPRLVHGRYRRQPHPIAHRASTADQHSIMTSVPFIYLKTE